MADDLRLDVHVAARSTGVGAVVSQMQAMAKATSSAATAQGRYTKATAATAASVSSVRAASAAAANSVQSTTSRSLAATAAMGGLAASSLSSADALRSVRNQVKSGSYLADFTTRAGAASEATTRLAGASLSSASAFRSIRNQVKSGSYLADFTRSASTAAVATSGLASTTMTARTALRSVRNQMRAGDFLADFTQGATAASAATSGVATAASAAAGGQRQLNDQTLRYANFDLASTLFTVSIALAAVGAAAAIAFASQEKAFTSVERILSGDGLGTTQIAELRDELVGLSEDIPVSFQELSEIASFGAALDIAAEDLDEFSSVVSRFTALTGADAEAAGKSLARIFQYTDEASPDLRRGEEFEQLGSAVVRLGNVSIATENDVLKFAQAISPLGIRAGVSANQILALATNTASFANINVQGAGSAFSRVFANIDRVAAGGGESLQAFADTAGVSAAQFQTMWADDAGGAFNKVIEGLNKDIPNLTTNLDELGIRNVRDRRVITALATNYEDYARYLNESNKAIQEGTFLGESYAFVADDLASKWQTFVNTLVNFGATIGGVVAPYMTALLDGASNLLQVFRDFAETPLGGVLTKIAAAAGTLVAVWATLRGLLAVTTAGFLALRTATAFLGGAGLARGVSFLAGAMLGLETRTKGAVGAMTLLRGAGSKVVGFFGGPLGLALTAAGIAFTAWATHVSEQASRARGEIVDSLQGAASDVEDVMGSIADTQDTDFWGNTAFNGQAFTDAEAAMEGLEATAGRLGEAMSFIDDQGFFTPNAGIRGLADSFGLTYKQALSLDGALDQAGQALDGLSGQEAITGLQEFGGVMDATNSELYQFASVEAPKTLESILDIGNKAGHSGTDMEIFNQVMSNADVSARAAADGVDESVAALSIMQEEAAALNGELDKLLSAFLEMSTESKSFEEAQNELSGAFNRAEEQARALKNTGRDLGGILSATDDEAIGFRDSLLTLEEKARSAAAAMVLNGEDTEAAMDKYREGRTAVINLLTSMGLAPEKAKKWADEMFGPTEEVKAQLQGVGAAADAANNKEVDVETSTNADETTTALDIMVAEANAADGTSAYIRIYRDTIFRTFEEAQRSPGHGVFPASDRYASGGYTGRGAKYEPAGVVHKGEYVIPKNMVNQSTGLPYADALGKLTRGSSGPGYATGGFVQPSGGFPSAISLTPGTVQQIAAAVQPFLVLDGRVMAESVNNQNSRMTTIGAN